MIVDYCSFFIYDNLTNEKLQNLQLVPIFISGFRCPNKNNRKSISLYLLNHIINCLIQKKLQTSL